MFSVLAAAILSLRVLERLQTFSAVAKSCFLSINVFFLLLGSVKSLWCAEKYFSNAKVIQSKR